MALFGAFAGLMVIDAFVGVEVLLRMYGYIGQAEETHEVATGLLSRSEEMK